MSGVNKVILVGHVGGEPDIRTTQEGKELATFSLATTESWKDRHTGEKRDRTEWHRIVVFNVGLAQVVKNYVHKGSKIYIEGALQTREYTGEDGIKRYSTEVVLQGFNSNLTMLDRKDSHDVSSPVIPSPPKSMIQDQAPKEDKKSDIAEILDDEVPF